MTVGVLLDTSFLISLVTQKRSHHHVAQQYFRTILDQNIAVYFSAIVAGEFAIKQPITELPLKKFRTLPFEIPHAIEAARLFNALGSRDEGDIRHVVREDVKLIAQANYENIKFILTDDVSTLYKYCERLRTAGSARPHRR